MGELVRQLSKALETMGSTTLPEKSSNSAVSARDCARMVIRHHNCVKRQPTVVQRRFAPLWQEKGWKRERKHYHGYYRTRYGAWRGLIVERYKGFIQFFVYSPPGCLRHHSHAACFIPKGGNQYEVHFSKRARTPDEGIMAIERIFTEAHEL